jgi:hypothetical protein
MNNRFSSSNIASMRTEHNHSRLLRHLTLPHTAVLLGVLLSFLAWIIPPLNSAGKGFVAASPSTFEFLATVAAYLFASGAAAVGYLFGRSMSSGLPRPSKIPSMDLENNTVWTASIITASIGVAITLLTIVRVLGFGGCVDAVMSTNANALKYALYENYSIGLLSLRYIAILSAAIAIFRYLAFKEVSLRSVISIGLLLSVALISSRLSLIWALVIGGMTYLCFPSDRPTRAISQREIIGWSCVFLLLLAALTVSRTYGYYESQGADSFVSSVGSEFQRYLAAPFQGSIEAVNTPQFATRLGDVGGIDSGLTTNSALMEFAILFGRWNVLALAISLFISGSLCGILKRWSGTYLILAFGVLQGCNLEIWRLSMFQRGVTITLMVFLLVVPVTLSFIVFPTIRIPRFRIKLH